MNPSDIEIYLTVTEAAQHINMSKEEVKDLVRIGVIVPYKAHPNDIRYLIPLSEIKAYQKRTVH